MPANIEIIPLPPYTPEMNPIEQIWSWLRRHGFRNEVFPSLEKVVDRLCDVICSLPIDAALSITHRD
ncbi:MAG: transposase [Oscillospiraceae bacterium]|nr:transposase [Oscillospiraceae bacterium]